MFCVAGHPLAMSPAQACHIFMWLAVCTAMVLSSTEASVDDADANVVPILASGSNAVGKISTGRRLLRGPTKPPPAESEEEYAIDHSGGPNPIYGVQQFVGYFQQWVSQSFKAHSHPMWVRVGRR